ncbi:MAG: nucleoside monophosphate kinase [Minisyncoccia bacterium]
MTQNNPDVRTILFIGRPGSGKETQARRLAELTGYHLFSTGERFRELREHRDALGERVKQVYDTGKLLPTWFAEYLFEDALLHLPHGAGVIFEGTGRWKEEAELFDEVAEWLNRPYRVINLEVSEEEVMRRQLSRARAEHRPDSDTEEKIRIRLDEFAKHTKEAVDFFRTKGAVVDINGEQSPDEVARDIRAAFHIA